MRLYLAEEARRPIGASRVLARAWSLLALTLALGCAEPPPRPVARLSVAPHHLALPFPQAATIDLSVAPLAPMDAAPLVFVHLLNADGEVVRTFDQPVGGDWTDEPFDLTIELYQSQLGPPLAAGVYRLRLGLYQAGRRPYAVTFEGESWPTVEVPAIGYLPSVGWSGDWEPVAAGGDQQILARRWLWRQGALVIGPLREPFVVGLDLLVPELAVPSPTLLVAERCGGVEHRRSGSGVHRLRLELAPPLGEHSCEIAITTDFVPVAGDGRPLPSSALQVLTLTPAAASGLGS